MVSRRDLLRWVAVPTAAGLAGCRGVFSGESGADTATRTPSATLAPDRGVSSSPSGPTEPGKTPTRRATPTDTPTDTPTPTDTATATPTPTGTPPFERVETAALTPSSEPHPQWFGDSVALSSGVALVGVYGGPLSVFESRDDGWERTATLSSQGAGSGFSEYSSSIALDGETAFLGGVSLTENGSVNVVERGDGEWSRREQITPTDPPEDGYVDFGKSVAYDDGTLVVGAVQNPGPMVHWRGDVFVFERSGDEWSQVAAFSSDANSLFGRRLAISGETLLVSAPAAGGEHDRDGAVYVYERSDGTWERETTLSIDADNTGFGGLVALDGDIAVVAATRHDETDPIYVFERTARGWTERATFAPPDKPEEPDHISALAVEGTTVLVGLPHDDAAGEVAGLEYTEGGLERTMRLVGEPRYPVDEFGAGVALADGTALVGAPTDIHDDRAGRAYLFDL
ncbi:FG-GAP repeat protein [Halosimplex sp. J119]